jgi:hypothetical protein
VGLDSLPGLPLLAYKARRLAILRRTPTQIQSLRNCLSLLWLILLSQLTGAGCSFQAYYYLSQSCGPGLPGLPLLAYKASLRRTPTQIQSLSNCLSLLWLILLSQLTEAGYSFLAYSYLSQSSGPGLSSGLPLLAYKARRLTILRRTPTQI